MNTPYPFAALVGQEQLRTALMLVSVDPGIGGLLISGPRGSAKSTAVRALGALNPQQPLVDVPLGASEEMITGTLDLERALKQSETGFRPGLLARADRGVLYVDEVNLLPDHLVDLLLDAAASGVNVVERDGVSHRHDARFVLVGTMNPDEGELRPQLLDRFGLMARMQAVHSKQERLEIVNRRLEYDRDPDAFAEKFAHDTRALAQQLQRAGENLEWVTMDKRLQHAIAERCLEADVEGLRADIIMRRAALAHAALHDRHVSDEDLDAVQDLVLRHRARQHDPGASGSPPGGAADGGPGDARGGAGSSSIQGAWGAASQASPASLARDVTLPPLRETPPRNAHAHDRRPEPGAGGRGAYRGPHTTAAATSATRRVDWYRSLAAFARRAGQAPRRQDLSYRHAQPGNVELDLVLLDTSASTLDGRGLACAKGVVESLSRRGYLERRRLGVITFGQDTVRTVMLPRRAPRRLDALLAEIPAGGGTPIMAALDHARGLLARRRFRAMHTHLVLITDGRLAAHAAGHELWRGRRATVIDIESGRVRLGAAKSLAQRIGARYLAPAAAHRRPAHPAH